MQCPCGILLTTRQPGWTVAQWAKTRVQPPEREFSGFGNGSEVVSRPHNNPPDLVAHSESDQLPAIVPCPPCWLQHGQSHGITAFRNSSWTTCQMPAFVLHFPDLPVFLFLKE